jgi:hypothetical protein
MKKLKLASPLKLNKETVAQLTQAQTPSGNKMVTSSTFSCGSAY